MYGHCHNLCTCAKLQQPSDSHSCDTPSCSLITPSLPLPCNFPSPPPPLFPPLHPPEEIKECNMYKLGFCIYGPACRYKHRPSPGPPPAVESIEAAKPREFRWAGTPGSNWKAEVHPLLARPYAGYLLVLVSLKCSLHQYAVPHKTLRSLSIPHLLPVSNSFAHLLSQPLGLCPLTLPATTALLHYVLGAAPVCQCSLPLCAPPHPSSSRLVSPQERERLGEPGEPGRD